MAKKGMIEFSSKKGVAYYLPENTSSKKGWRPEGAVTHTDLTDIADNIRRAWRGEPAIQFESPEGERAALDNRSMFEEPSELGETSPLRDEDDVFVR
jgi:hypothetical protein